MQLWHHLLLLATLASAHQASRATCTCEEAEKSPLAHEFAYRSGICQGSPKELGADDTTTVCLQAVHDEYNKGGKFNGAEPENFNASTAQDYPVFHGVAHVRLPPDEVVDKWSCTAETDCGDCDPESAAAPLKCSDERGFASLWVPNGTTTATARLLFVHGGSWLYGSPETASYAPFCAMIARTAGMPVLAIDYTLAPVGNFTKILAQVGRALHWLATHDPPEVVRHGAAAAVTPLEESPMLFIAGDSSGGGTAASALLAQSAAGLPAASGAWLSGGVLFSPWLNLPCDTPSYVSQGYKLESVSTASERVTERCDIPGLERDQPRARVSVGGDVAFTGYPHTLSADFAANGRTYAGSSELMLDPVASPMRALPSTLAKMPPVQIHVGLGEVLIAENVMFATKMAAAGGACELHEYDQMWHVFTMYFEGCEHPKIKKLLFAYSSLNLTATFLNGLVERRGEVGWRRNGAPFTLTHYEYPRGVDSAMHPYHQSVGRPAA